jgi:hypothetical protein
MSSPRIFQAATPLVGIMKSAEQPGTRDSPFARDRTLYALGPVTSGVKPEGRYVYVTPARVRCVAWPGGARVEAVAA